MFNVYFQYGETVEERDFLEGFVLESEAKTYRKEQIEIEGWDDEIGTESDQYVIIEQKNL